MCFNPRKVALKVGIVCAEQQILTTFSRYHVFYPELVEPQSRYDVCPLIKELVKSRFYVCL